MNLPTLHRVAVCTQADMDGAVKRSLAHLILVSLDALAGLVGARIPFITISTRTALAILAAQEAGTTAAPWARWLGAALEAVDPGHLQAAMVADLARAQFVERTISRP